MTVPPPYEPQIGVHIDTVRAELGEPVKVLNYKSGERGEIFQFEELWEVEASGNVMRQTSSGYTAMYDTKYAGVHKVRRRIDFTLDQNGIVTNAYQEQWWDLPGKPVRKMPPKETLTPLPDN